MRLPKNWSDFLDAGNFEAGADGNMYYVDTILWKDGRLLERVNMSRLKQYFERENIPSKVDKYA